MGVGQVKSNLNRVELTQTHDEPS